MYGFLYKNLYSVTGSALIYVQGPLRVWFNCKWPILVIDFEIKIWKFECLKQWFLKFKVMFGHTLYFKKKKNWNTMSGNFQNLKTDLS